jgi:hypothetical protein
MQQEAGSTGYGIGQVMYDLVVGQNSRQQVVNGIDLDIVKVELRFRHRDHSRSIVLTTALPAAVPGLCELLHSCERIGAFLQE